MSACIGNIVTVALRVYYYYHLIYFHTAQVEKRFTSSSSSSFFPFFFFFFFFFFVLFCVVLVSAPEKASSRSVECHTIVNSCEDFRDACSSDENSEDWYNKCTITEAHGTILKCYKCSPNYLSGNCRCTEQERGCAKFCYSITRDPVQTLLSLRTCLPDGKSQTGRYH